MGLLSFCPVCFFFLSYSSLLACKGRTACIQEDRLLACQRPLCLQAVLLRHALPLHHPLMVPRQHSPLAEDRQTLDCHAREQCPGGTAREGHKDTAREVQSDKLSTEDVMLGRRRSSAPSSFKCRAQSCRSWQSKVLLAAVVDALAASARCFGGASGGPGVQWPGLPGVQWPRV
jgi:hypothetical protein